MQLSRGGKQSVVTSGLIAALGLGWTVGVQAQPAPVAVEAGIAAGWPQSVPDAVTGTPVGADLDGDGKLEVVVPCMGRPGYAGILVTMAHPEPSLAAQIFAFKTSGDLLPGWPVRTKSVQERSDERKMDPGLADNWESSPSVADVNGDGLDDIVITTGGHYDATRHIWGLLGDGRKAILTSRGDPWISVPLADVDGDGTLDMVSGNVLSTIDGKAVPGWPTARRFHGGYQSCIGDANNDGQVEVYHPTYEFDYHLPDKPINGTIGGFNRQGEPLPGWPQKVDRLALYVVMGDVTGDDKKEICCVDIRGRLHLWTWDGQPLPSTHAAGPYTSIFKDGRFASNASPSLADLDGDGKAEIVVYEPRTHSLRAWHGDGSGVYHEDGLVARLPDEACGSWGTASIADLNGDGAMDFFIGTHWVRAAKDGTATVVSMLPGEATARTTTGCSIVDLKHDGQAQVLFGLADGRVFVFNTGQTLTPATAQWPTPSGNFRHTGVWQPLQIPSPPAPPTG